MKAEIEKIKVRQNESSRAEPVGTAAGAGLDLASRSSRSNIA